jgi:hypothetical protein
VARVIYQVEEKLEEEVAPVSAVPAEPEIIGRGKKEEELEEEAEAKPGAKPAAKPAAKATSKNE